MLDPIRPETIQELRVLIDILAVFDTAQKDALSARVTTLSLEDGQRLLAELRGMKQRQDAIVAELPAAQGAALQEKLQRVLRHGRERKESEDRHAEEGMLDNLLTEISQQS